MADTAATIRLGDLTVARIGYGAMQLCGPGVWGPPPDAGNAVRVLRCAVDLGATFIDTADSYGPGNNEELIRQALYPYPEELVIGTKGGLVRPGPDLWEPLGRPAYLRQSVELSLRRLGLERIDLYQLHRVDSEVPLADQIGELKNLQAEGKIRHIGLSEVSVDVIEQARAVAEVVSVQNIYNVQLRHHDKVLDYAAANGLVFIPFFPLGGGERTDLADAVAAAGVSRAQLLLAWLLQRSPAVLAIPGTASIDHVKENLAAASLDLPAELIASLDEL